jgi:hypothetical protein
MAFAHTGTRNSPQRRPVRTAIPPVHCGRPAPTDAASIAWTGSAGHTKSIDSNNLEKTAKNGKFFLTSCNLVI